MQTEKIFFSYNKFEKLKIECRENIAIGKMTMLNDSGKMIFQSVFRVILAIQIHILFP
jgi:hypothetical protein